MKLGIAYYPEYNERENWAKDFANIKNAGIKRIRMGEFAWSLIQPNKDTYNWDWMDQSIELAAKYGIEVIVGTPTGCPPIWLVEEFPDVLPVNREGRRSGFGARQHRCFNSPDYIDYSKIIVEELAKRYGNHPNVVAWQIDNELGGEQKYCYCKQCQRKFQLYLQSKYQSIEELNFRWGNHFWSQDYSKWEQIPVPMRFASDMDMRPHPSLELEFMRFSSNSIVEFSNMQAEIIRRYSDKIITTNTDTFRFGDNVNIYELYKKLDIAGIDIYSDSMCEITFYSDVTRSLKQQEFWMMEFGTGNSELRQQMEQCKIHGCEWFLFFTYKPFLAGQEQGFKGLVTITGEMEANYDVVKKWSEAEIQKEKQVAFGTRNREKIVKDVLPKIGIYYDFDSSWSYTIDTYGNQWFDRLVYPKYILDTLYKSLYESNLNVGFAFSAEDIGRYSLLILPLNIIYNEELEMQLMDFVFRGGKLIVTDDLFRKNKDNVYMTHEPQIFTKLFGTNGIGYVKQEGSVSPIVYSGKYGEGNVWMVRKDFSEKDWGNLLMSMKI